MEAAFAEAERLYGSVLDGGRISRGPLRIVALRSSVFYSLSRTDENPDGSHTQLLVFLSTMPGIALRGGYIDRESRGTDLRLHRRGKDYCVCTAADLSAGLVSGTGHTAEDATAVLALMNFTETVLEPFIADLSTRLAIELP